MLILVLTPHRSCPRQSVLIFVFSPQWSVFLPPHSLVVFAYGAGVVLLFGGTRLFRAALFPLLLLWFVNPVPHIFNVFVDLPLQRISAHVARAFAIALGQPLSPDQIRLMFTPDFGMFIAPGCNGIRGAVTMGFIALIAGYLYRFRWYAHAAVVAGAVLLGYVFNFARLCILVLYYLVALHFPWLQTGGDGRLHHRRLPLPHRDLPALLRRAPSQRIAWPDPPPAAITLRAGAGPVARSFYPRFFTFLSSPSFSLSESHAPTYTSTAAAMRRR